MISNGNITLAKIETKSDFGVVLSWEVKFVKRAFFVENEAYLQNRFARSGSVFEKSHLKTTVLINRNIKLSDIEDWKVIKNGKVYKILTQAPSPKYFKMVQLFLGESYGVNPDVED